MDYILHKGMILYRPIENDYSINIQKKIEKDYRNLKWRKQSIKNECQITKKITKITFHNTQKFLKEYFKKNIYQKGMILYHSVGSGKTASGVAIGSNFEDEYKILWVTQYKLRNDMWKNITGQFSAHEKFRILIDKNKLPDDLEKQKKIFNKITNKSWIQPITYKQFSNMLLKKNQLSDFFYNRNNLDPLHKVLIIIDEAHNLYNKSLPEHQKPNIKIIKKMIYNSYEISKNNSCKIILLTATPLLDDVMSYLKLINLIIPNKKQRFNVNIDDFTKKYLTPDLKKFTNFGLDLFNRKTSRLVSYLNVKKNINQFSQPITFYKNIKIEDLEKTENQLLDEIKNLKQEQKNIDTNLLKKYKLDNFKNYTELLKYIKKDDNIEKLQKINSFLDINLNENDVKLFNKKKLSINEKEIINNIKDNIKFDINNKKNQMSNEKKNTINNIKSEIKNNKKFIEENKDKLDYQINKCIDINDNNINKKIKCIQTKNLWSSEKEFLPIYRFENKKFNKDLLKKQIPIYAKKIELLFKNIKRLDEKSLNKNNKLYKHVIYIHNSGYKGMKLLISLLISLGFNFLLENNKGLKIKDVHNNYNFLCLTGGSIYDKLFNKKITKKINLLFNSRPDNIFGQKCRFLLIDYNYKEGIDLYDTKYFHILDPYLFETELEQLIGRNTRRCGQSGLPFNSGWKLLCYLYYNKYENKRNIEDIIKNLRGNQIGLSDKDIKIRNVVKKEIINNAIDKLLNSSKVFF